jgi:hypothetical protein
VLGRRYLVEVHNISIYTEIINKKESIIHHTHYLKRALLSDTSASMLGVAFNGFRRLCCSALELPASACCALAWLLALLLVCPVTATPLPDRIVEVLRDLLSILAHDRIRLFSRSSSRAAESLLIYDHGVLPLLNNKKQLSTHLRCIVKIFVETSSYGNMFPLCGIGHSDIHINIVVSRLLIYPRYIMRIQGRFNLLEAMNRPG